MKTKTLTILSIVMLLSTGVFAQNSDKKFGFEINGGVSFPFKEINDTKMNTGFGFEGLFHYRFLPHLGVYAGWGWNNLSADNSFAGEDVSLEETGYIFGLQFMHPIGDSPISYYVRGAGLYNHIEIENSDGDITHDTGHDFGFQIGAGVNIKLGETWSINPGVKFNALNQKSDIEGVSMDIDYQYISARIGLIKLF